MSISEDHKNNQGYCNGYAVAATSKEELFSRLEEIPINLRQEARRHCQTVWALRKYAKQAI